MKEINKLNKLYNQKPFKDYLLKPKLKNIKFKNINEVKREFQKEEWNSLLYKILQSNKKLDVYQVDKIYNNFDKKIIFYKQKRMYLDTTKNVQNQYIRIYLKTILKYLNKGKINSIVELGSGYGSKIINLSLVLNSLNFNNRYYAGELSEKGRAISKIISSNSNIKLKTFEFSYFSKEKYKKIPINSVLFTSYSMPYMKKLDKRFFNYLKIRKPKIVINFEPFYETHNKETLHGRICRNYIIKNDYCRNHLTYFKEMEKKKFIKIINFQPNVFGSNPMLPISIIIWKFV